MVIQVKGCIYPECEGGLKCPLSTPPSRCDLDLTEQDKTIMELEKKVAEGKRAAKQLAAIKTKKYQKEWNARHRKERNEYQLKRYHERKERAKDGNNTNV